MHRFLNHLLRWTSTSRVLYGLMVIGNPLTSTGIQPSFFHGFTTTVQSRMKLLSTIVGVAKWLATMGISILAQIVITQVLPLLQTHEWSFIEKKELLLYRYSATTQMGKLFYHRQEVVGFPSQCPTVRLLYYFRTNQRNSWNDQLWWKHVIECRTHSLRRDFSYLRRASERYGSLDEHQWWSHLLVDPMDTSKWYYNSWCLVRIEYLEFCSIFTYRT